MATDSQDSQPWNCLLCTFQNHGDLKRCEMCLQPKFSMEQMNISNSNADSSAENEVKQDTSSNRHNSNSSSNSNSNSNPNPNSTSRKPGLSNNRSQILQSMNDMANDLFGSKETNVVNSGIYLKNIVSSYEAMVNVLL